MARSEFLYIPGKIYWCRGTVPEVYGDERFWSVTVYPTTDGMKVVKSLYEAPPIMNRLRRDDDGDFIKFKRPCSKKFKGAITALLPPRIIDKDDQPITALVGNGSDGIVKVEVYSFNKPRVGRAARWDSLRIDNFVPYESKRDMLAEEERQVRNFDKQPLLPAF